MDEKIVILLTLLFAALGFISKLKKNKQEQPVSEKTNQQQSFWDLIQGTPDLQNNLEQEEFEEPDFTNETEYATQPQNKVEKTKGYQFVPKSEGLSDIEDLLKPKTKELRKKSRLIHNFSIRKAVIYSEILNRKYT